MQLIKLPTDQHSIFKWAYVFSFIGLIVAGYLLYEYSRPGQIGCSLQGCQTVRESEYSSLFGISLPVYGVAFFLFHTIYSSSRLISRKVGKYENLFLLLTTGWGFLFSIYLTYIEVFVIHALCQWCLMTGIAATFLFILTLRLHIKKLPPAQ